MSHEKDIAEKNFERLNDVFADIFNVLVFHGDQVLHPEDLVDVATRTPLKLEDELHEQERDVAKLWNGPDGSIVFALCGVENQTEPDRDIALRCIAYDGASYKQQVNQHSASEKKHSKKQKEKRIPTYPVVTLVLYFGERKWTTPTTLFDAFEVPIDERLRPLINDYRANVIDVRYLPKGTAHICQSDFRYMVSWMPHVGTDTLPDEFLDGKIDHPDELLKFMSAVTKDNRFIDAYTNMEKKEDVRMCDIIDRFEARGIAIGEAKGEANGKKLGFAEAQYKAAVSMFRKGLDEEIVRDCLAGFPAEQLAKAKEEAARLPS